MHKELSHEEALFFLNRFHGHIGPYLVLGYRAGLIANRILGDDPFAKRAHTMTGSKTPISCFTDGVQLGSCCTLGKGNITVSDEGEPRVRFELADGSEGIEVCLTDEAKARIATAHDWDGADRLGRQMLTEPEEELFVINHTIPAPADS
ncbi:hypothetical protein CEE36_05470 [candidate division TA06 bacterium B3_TA06]|uniref:Formylmethanofuran dehydrogenase subunit E domain-containing protein n=1 Tax=candidate division TA06 bacterium B3_TA06 TaxID=2012487 RepID=A0A532V7J9_UNCT6|nr:MAG: hypothetical protein CEE36_05470 [candidate division TA06 bacterium B3_TA06]